MPLERKTRQQVLFSWHSLLMVLRRASLLLLLLLAISLLLFQAAKKDKIEAFRDHALGVITPIIEVLGLPVGYVQDFFGALGHLGTVYTENAELKAENIKLTAQQDEMRLLKAENRYLRKMMNVIPESKIFYITARVVADASTPYNHSILINTGISNGVERGMVAFSDNGVVGRVVSVDDNSSRILLLTDLNARVPAITELARERAIAAGTNGTLLKLDYLPEDTHVKVGEQVITSGDGAYFPQGLVVGIVESVKDNEVLVRPLFDEQRLEYVTLVRFAPATAE